MAMPDRDAAVIAAPSSSQAAPHDTVRPPPAPDGVSAATATSTVPGSFGFGPGAFRLVLAALVFLSHVSRFNLGRVAVMLFFMLSGFWVTRLFDLRRDPSVGPYLRDRFLRVWPLLSFVAVAVAVVTWVTAAPSRGNLLSTVALLGLASRHNDIVGVAWSLDVEMQFYLALPLIVLAAGRVAATARPAVVAAVLGVATALGAALLARGVVTVFAYIPAFLVGALIWRWKAVPGGRIAMASLAAFAAVLAVLAAFPSLSWAVPRPGPPPWWSDLSQMAICLPLIPFVAWNVNQPSPGSDRHLGNLSYPFYLVHYPLIVVARSFVPGGASKPVALALGIVATLVLYAAVDRPLERVRRITLRAVRAGDRGRGRF